MKRKNRYVDHLPIRSLSFDPSYQREISPAKIKKLVREWNDEAVGVIHVSIRENDGAYVVDGNHRVHAAIEKGLSEMKAACLVYRDLTQEAEAQLFLSLNDQKTISIYDRYKAGLIAKDPVCIGIRRTLDHYGLAISNGSTEGSVRCIGEVMDIYKKDPRSLDAVCLILTEAWGTRITAFENVVVGGVGKVVGRYNGELDQSVLVKKLAGYRGGPSALAGDARGLSDYRPGTGVKRAAAEIIIETYNRGRRKGQLAAL